MMSEIIFSRMSVKYIGSGDIVRGLSFPLSFHYNFVAEALL
jgi:hypothetical protein